MNKELLLKYISGKASQQEKEEVATWIDADAANLKEFISLRKSYDAFLWQDTESLSRKTKKTFSLRPVARWVWQIAAVFVVAFGLNYIMIQAFQKENVEMQTVYVPAGQRTLVTLADGTTVWVNGKSTLTFPNRFSSRTRKVELDGEAYFDVRKDPEKQFIVSTAHQSAIKVLGTKFNVKAYKEADEVITTLVEGKVNFEFNNAGQQPQYIIMAPGQKLVYNSQNGKTQLYTTSGERELSWKDGKIIFRQTSLRDALDILADRYNAEFVIQENVPHDDSFSGTFTNRNLEQVLNFISVSSKVHWRYLNNNGTAGKEKIKIEIFI
ncbi:FecR domain-containing protein [Bacteroides acidifaciens]|uniref:FecR family protein n=1 Tax=Bacteroides acidifaciens TaxID=85831 RepID=UPI003014EA8A